MSGEMAVSLALKFKDQGSALATQAFNKIKQELKGVGEAAKSSSAAAVASFQKLASAREILGIRSEKAIQNEIKQTEAAYNRMAHAGIASARELGRAQDAMKNKVAELRREMEGVKTSAGGMGKALGVAVGVVGAYQAGKMVLSGPIKKTMDYDRQLALAANTAFAGQSVDERKAGMGTIHAAVKATVQNGGTADSALASYATLAGSGEYKSPAEIAAALPQIQRAATANGGSPEEFAKIALAAKRNLGLDDFSRVANMATTAGQLGGFEIKDMAKSLPELMASAKNAGLSGYSGYASLLALTQASVSTAATPDAAANNAVNLLGKINSRDTAADFKKQGIDLDGSLLKAQESGTNTLEAFGNLVDRVVAKDKRYAALKEKAKNATGSEQKEIYNNMAQIAEGAGIGKVLQDRQALMGFLAYRTQHEKYGQFGTNTTAIKNTGDSVGGNFDLVSETASFKTEVLAANRALAMQEALDKVNPLLGSLAEGISGLIQKNPELAAAMEGTVLATTALAASATAASVALMLVAGGAGGGKGAVRTVLETGKKFFSGGSWATAGRAGLAVAPLAAMGWMSSWAGDTSHDEERVRSRQGVGNTVSDYLGYMGFDKGADIEARRAKNREELTVVVDVRNGNIVAEVEKAQQRTAGRH